MALRGCGAVWAVAVGIVVALSGCAGEAEGPATGATPDASGPTRTVEAESTESLDPDVPRVEGSGCDPVEGPLPDGLWFGTVVELSEDELVIDVACWFTGEDAVLAAEEDGAESPPPNDYYVRDTSDDTNTVPVAPDATTLFYLSGEPTETTGTISDLLAASESRPDYPYGIWVEIAGGVVVSVQEQWVP